MLIGRKGKVGELSVRGSECLKIGEAAFCRRRLHACNVVKPCTQRSARQGKARQMGWKDTLCVGTGCMQL